MSNQTDQDRVQCEIRELECLLRSGEPLPRNMREADALGYVPYAGSWTDTKTRFVSENEMVVTALSMDVATEPGRDHLPRIKARFTAHFKFGPIEPGK